MFFIGILDDLLSLSPFKKLIGQILSVLVIMFLIELQINSFKGLFDIYEIHMDFIYFYNFCSSGNY